MDRSAPDGTSVNGLNGPIQPAGGRRAMRTGTCIALIAVGAILRFAVTTSSSHGLNVHVVGVILILVGVLGLVLSLVVWGPLNPARRRVYRDQSQVVEERRVYRDQSPL